MDKTFLRDEPIFWSRLGRGRGPVPREDDLAPEPGAVINPDRDVADELRYHRAFYGVGVRVFSTFLDLGWVDENEYDYTLTDRTLREVFSCGEDVYFVPRVNLDVPRSWCLRHPDETFVYWEGPRDAETVRSLVGTDRQDLYGYEAEFGGVKGGLKPLIARQSFSSEAWLREAGEAVRRLVEHVKESPYGDRVLCFHLGWGACGECVLWGRDPNHYGDYGVNHRRHFYDWGVEKYGSPEKLGEVWRQPGVTRDTVVLPLPDARYENRDDIDSFFRGRPEDRIAEDMDRFLCRVNNEAVIYFAREVKRGNPAAWTCFFYGYFVHVDNAAYTGFTDLSPVLDCPEVDFLCGPKSYYRCGPGEPSGELSAPQSVNLKKIWLDETDNRTFLSRDVTIEGWRTATMGESLHVLWREMSKNMAHGSGFWWMDLGGGWYDDGLFVAEMGKLAAADRRIRAKGAESTADILFVVDDDAINRLNISTDLRLGFLEDLQYELQMSGALPDTYRLCDLEDLPLAQYKLIVFAYTFQLDRELWQRLETKIPRGTAVMFNHAAGIWDGDSFGLRNVERRTGFAVFPRADRTSTPEIEAKYRDVPWLYDRGGVKGFDFPQLGITPSPGDRIFRRGRDGAITVVCRDAEAGLRIMNTEPYLNRHELRALAEEAGCHLFAPEGTILFGDSRFMGCFSREPVEGELRLREAGDYENLVTGEVFSNTDTLPLRLGGKDAAVFVRK